MEGWTRPLSAWPPRVRHLRRPAPERRRAGLRTVGRRRSRGHTRSRSQGTPGADALRIGGRRRSPAGRRNHRPHRSSCHSKPPGRGGTDSLSRGTALADALAGGARASAPDRLATMNGGSLASYPERCQRSVGSAVARRCCWPDRWCTRSSCGRSGSSWVATLPPEPRSSPSSNTGQTVVAITRLQGLRPTSLISALPLKKPDSSEMKAIRPPERRAASTQVRTSLPHASQRDQEKPFGMSGNPEEYDSRRAHGGSSTRPREAGAGRPVSRFDHERTDSLVRSASPDLLPLDGRERRTPARGCSVPDRASPRSDTRRGWAGPGA